MKARKIFLLAILSLWFNAVTADLKPLNIDENNVDLFLPTPVFFDQYYRLRRSYQPFGETSAIDFETAVLQASTGSVRITQLKINGINYWLDLVIKIKAGKLILDVSAMGTGAPPVKFPRWSVDTPGLEIDFILSSADIFGPPARIRIFDIGIDYGLYDLDFVLGNDAAFVLANIYAKGYSLYALTPDETQAFIVASQSDELFSYVNQNYLNFSDTAFLSPLALPWDGQDGEQSILINYATGSQLQTMMATDGILLGTYSPPLAKASARSFNTFQRSITSTAMLDAELSQCIDKKTQLIAGFKADNQLSQQLVDMVLTLAGHSSLTALSSKTTQKIMATIADSKDVVLEMMANGKVDDATLGVYVSTTLLKSLTPDEYQVFIKQIWGNNIPNDVQAAAKASGSLAESNYKIAAQALAEGIASKVFPAYTAAVKTVIQSVKYAKDTLADDSFHELYKLYKASNGNWDDVVTSSVLSTNKYADQKVREILKSQKKPYDDKAVSVYLEDKMKTLYANEPLMAKEREKLNRAKEKFKNLPTTQINILKNRMPANYSNCDLFQKYIDYVSKTQIDLKNSIRNCTYAGLSSSEIENQAYFLTKYKLRDTGTSAERRALYQKDKLAFLKRNNCLNYEQSTPQTIPEGGAWILAESITWRDPAINDHECYESSAVVSDGSYTSRTAVFDDVCNWKYSENISFTGSWSSPPNTLIPGESYPAAASISRSNPVEQWGTSDYIYLYMDNHETRCGYVTASNRDINTESVSVGWRASDPSSASWSGTFTAPDFGYAGSSTTNKFQIKAGGKGGCIRYIYEWNE